MRAAVHALALVLCLSGGPPAGAAPDDETVVRAFLERHCSECHGNDAGEIRGEFAIDAPWPTMAAIGGRVAYASILERLRAGDMPPPDVKRRPDAGESARVTAWILAQLDTPLPGPPVAYDVREKPVDGNRLPHAILFGGPRGPTVPPPPRLWRLSPEAYEGWVGPFHGGDIVQKPFALTGESGIRDYAALYSLDDGAASLLLGNAELLVERMTARYAVINIGEKPEATNKAWPTPDRIESCTPAERTLLEQGMRVVGGRVFAPLMHPQVAATRPEIETALAEQFRIALARAPEPDEVNGLVKLYEAVAREGDHRLAGKTVLMAPLLSAEAVLRFEIGTGSELRPGVRMLGPREIAQAVSLALCARRERGMFDKAAQGGLRTAAEVAAEVQRILDTDAVQKPRILQFFREYFGYRRAIEVFKDALPQERVRRGQRYHAPGMVEEAEARIVAAIKADRRVFEELLAGIDSGKPGRGGDLTTRRRSGVLMDPAWLVAWSTNFHNDPVRRGRWIREQLLGGRVPDLPNDTIAVVPDAPDRTLRERHAVTRDAACWKCHYRMDDLGLPFEGFDHYGYARDAEEVLDREAMEREKDRKVYRGVPLDTSGVIAHSGDPKIDGPVADPQDMLQRLVSSERVRQVFIRHVFRFFMGRNETPGDAPALQDADRAYVESGGSFKAVVVSLLSSESFLCRSIVAPAGRPGSTVADR